MSIVLFTAVAVLLLLATYTFWRVRQIEAKIRPDGLFMAVDGVLVHYHFFPAREERAEDPVLVFLHGASGNGYDTRLAFLNHLEGKYPLLFVDRPGLGFSGRNGSDHDTPEGQAQLLARFLEKLGVQAAIVVGHSLGGAVTAALGLAVPERVRGLAFVAPVSHPWPGGVNWYYRLAATPFIGQIFSWTVMLPIAERLAPAAIENVFYPDKAPENYTARISVPLMFRPGTFQANARDIVHLKKAVTAQSKRYSLLTQPALIVSGTEDTVVWPSIHCEGLLKDLSGAELIMLDRAGHMPHHTHAPHIAAALDGLVARLRSEKNAIDAPGDGRRPLEPA